MLPYEILIGFRRTMCTCACGLIGKQNSLKQLNIKVHNLHKFSTNTRKDKATLRLSHIDVSRNSIATFHTQLSTKCQASEKDSDPINNDPLLGNEYLLKRRNHKRDPKLKVITDESRTQESLNKWIFSESEKVPSKDIEKKFVNPKLLLHNIYTLVFNENKIPQCYTKTTKPEPERQWRCTYNIKWPENMSFTSVERSKALASESAALKCLYWLHLNGKIQNNRPVIYDKDEISSIIHRPDYLTIDPNILDTMNNFLDGYEKNIMTAIDEIELKKPVANMNQTNLRNWEPHIISEFAIESIEQRNEFLRSRLSERKNVSNTNLPIFQFKTQILEELENNQALVIKGDTGCGKTTQIPQFIMDHFTSKGIATACNMIVTQPRRISAISLAERIAFERGEQLGDVVGYKVRLKHVLPKQSGAILFCTTGILLKKMQSNPTLDGCSHVIVDEAHERTVDTDMLLVILRRAMKSNPSLKVIIMSATIRAELFQNYLGCKSVEVPGRLFPVQMNFLEDIEKLGIHPSNNIVKYQEIFVDCDQIIDLIRYISQNKPPGAILCFLPGWSHIHRINNLLEEHPIPGQIVIPLHSKIPYHFQNKIFSTVSDDERKIILATDIAETGITVPDVVYVIDSGCHKEMRWHESKGISSIDTHWISKANINQRKGRAGRVQSGESFHFISKKNYEELDAYPVPEVLRSSLEKTVLDAKTYSNEKAVDFLGSMPQPPRLSAVEKAVMDLEIIGALDKNENLTALGRKISLFPLHPKLSKAILYSAIFQCISPIVSVTASLSLDQDIFSEVLLHKNRIREIKKHFHPASDHLSIAWLYIQWLHLYSKNLQKPYSFCKKHYLHSERMLVLHQVRRQNLEHLREVGMIRDVDAASSLNSKENEFAMLDELVRGVLLASMDQVLKYRDFEIRKGRITRRGSSMVTEDGAKTQLTPESVNYKRESWPSPFLTYYQKTHHDERRTTLIRECSIISPVTVLLFSQRQITGTTFDIPNKEGNQNNNKVLLRVEGFTNVNLLCDEKAARTILRFRDVMWRITRCHIEYDLDGSSLLNDEDSIETKKIVAYKKEMLNVLSELMKSTMKFIDTDVTTKSSTQTGKN